MVGEVRNLFVCICNGVNGDAGLVGCRVGCDIATFKAKLVICVIKKYCWYKWTNNLPSERWNHSKLVMINRYTYSMKSMCTLF